MRAWFDCFPLCSGAACRNSKLTFRLQDALGGGNSKLLVIACISTAKSDLSGMRVLPGVCCLEEGACTCNPQQWSLQVQ